MPVDKSARQYGFFQAIAHGGARKPGGPSPEQAREMIHKTPPEKRKLFAKRLARYRRKGED